MRGTGVDKPKKEPIALHNRQDYRLCLNCGFPNRQSDTVCMYCSASLVEDTGFFSWLKQSYYILRWRYQLRQKRENLKRGGRGMGWARGLGYFSLGIFLSFTGVYFFSHSITENSFSNGLIALLLLGYGVFTLRGLFRNKR
ncbi:hypothetical protein [Nitrospina gracilis]|uniref:hypothetical protein n=1 Tax=Nitrospina gracilis TaxID=35801 RepID=UPI001F440C0C|nr:hypothetical protein [Nitrospina gracilis]MCF8721014.1 hypothetical protein [Nitrospina gracilis Nb-211]